MSCEVPKGFCFYFRFSIPQDLLCPSARFDRSEIPATAGWPVITVVFTNLVSFWICGFSSESCNYVGVNWLCCRFMNLLLKLLNQKLENHTQIWCIRWILKIVIYTFLILFARLCFDTETFLETIDLLFETFLQLPSLDPSQIVIRSDNGTCVCILCTWDILFQPSTDHTTSGSEGKWEKSGRRKKLRTFFVTSCLYHSHPVAIWIN